MSREPQLGVSRGYGIPAATEFPAKVNAPPFVWAETEQPPPRRIFDDDPVAIEESRNG